jgi:polyphosphate kinase
MKKKQRAADGESAATGPSVDPTGPESAPRYLNRELSWLDFNRRVLALAEDPSLPLLERVKFLAIFSQNLDEFFQVRVALLCARHEADLDVRSPDGRSTEEQRAAVRVRVLELIREEQDIFAKHLLPELEQAGIRIVDWNDLSKRDRKHLRNLFEERIFPVLTPLAVDPAHPFPYVSDLSFNLGVLVRHPGSSSVRFARIKVPPLLGRFLVLEAGDGFIPIEQVIAAHLDSLFPGMVVESSCPFRVTRDADLALEEDEAEDLMAAIETGLHRRRRSSDAVRLEVDASVSPRVRQLLADELDLDEADVYVRRDLLDLGALWQLYQLDRPDLKYEPWMPRLDPRLSATGESGEPRDVFALLRGGDMLMHHPYDSFDDSVGAFLARAAEDPQVLTIKHTIYRTSGPENPVGRALIRAAKNGKQVVALVELKARFDEETNIDWARKLGRAGVHVVYGLLGLKTHGKISLVVRQEEGGIRRYCHVGTGNYNPVTARLYEDVGLFSASPEVGADLSELFNQLTGYSRNPRYRKILAAPGGLRPPLIDLVRQEMEQPDGRIAIKCNSVSDRRMIDALYAASQAGVQIDIIARGVCCLRPGVPGLSEKIRVRSIIGRFLEHSRIFRFGSEARGFRYFIGSADVMLRNLEQRIEVMVPVEDPALQQRLGEILALLLADDALAWELGPDDTWTRVPRSAGLDSQAELQRLARERSRSD